MSPSGREANSKDLASSEREIAQLITRAYLNNRDLETITAKRISAHEVLRQLEMFFRDAEPCRLMRPARVADGIVKITPDEIKTLISLHNQAAERGRMLAFVPASGAASRMFNDWHIC